MKTLIVAAVVVACGGLIYWQVSSGGDPDLTVKGDEVLLATDDLDVRFARGGTLDETFMIFGGIHLNHGNAVSNVSLSAIPMKRARPIHRRYPDFHRCASPGAAAAKDAVVQLDVVPGDGRALKTLKSTLDDFDSNTRKGGDRVCVELHGAKLSLKSAEIRGHDQDVTSTLKRQNYFLVDSAEQVDCQAALAGA